MMEVLEAECRALAAAASEQRDRADRLQALADHARAQAARDEQAMVELARVLGIDPSAPPVDDDMLHGRRLTEVAVAILHEHRPDGDPIHYREWYGLLRLDGWLVGGNDPVQTFLAAVSRAPGVTRVGQRSGLYAIAHTTHAQ